MRQIVADFADHSPDLGIAGRPQLFEPIDHVAHRKRLDIFSGQQQQTAKQLAFDQLMELLEQAKEPLNAHGIVFVQRGEALRGDRKAQAPVCGQSLKAAEDRFACSNRLSQQIGGGCVRQSTMPSLSAMRSIGRKGAPLS